MAESSPTCRPPAVAGLFYPDDADTLRLEVADFLRPFGSHEPDPDPAAAPQVLLVPHAGYRFSGGTAGVGYQTLAAPGVYGTTGRFRRAVIIGPAHRVAVRGVADAGVAFFATPLGRLRVDIELLATLRERLATSHPRLLVTSGKVHAEEHSVEVHLPFVQHLDPAVPVLPLVAGDVAPQEMGALVSAVLADADTVLIISSDMSHYLPEAEAHTTDRDTLDRIAALRYPLPAHSACGRIPINGVLDHATRHGFAATELDYTTSADVPAGDAHRVVGYAAVRFDPLGPQLPALARATLEQHLGAAPVATGETAVGVAQRYTPLLRHPWMRRQGASFVTLTRRDGSLRGCIGTISAFRPLGDDVQSRSIDAALHDPRFPAVSASELADLRIEVSVLTTPELIDPTTTSTEEETVAVLRPGLDGIILASSDAPGAPRGTFLPSVWQQLPDPHTFLTNLKAKAGLPTSGWSPKYRLWRYQTEAFDEGEGQ